MHRFLFKLCLVVGMITQFPFLSQRAYAEENHLPIEVRLFESSLLYTAQRQGQANMQSYSLLGGGVEGVMYVLRKDLSISANYLNQLHIASSASIFSALNAGLGYDIVGRSYMGSDYGDTHALIIPRILIRAKAGIGKWHYDFSPYQDLTKTKIYLSTTDVMTGDFWAMNGGLLFDYLINLKQRLGIEVFIHRSFSNPEKHVFLMSEFCFTATWIF